MGYLVSYLCSHWKYAFSDVWKCYGRNYEECIHYTSWQAHFRLALGWVRLSLGGSESGIKYVNCSARSHQILGAEKVIVVWHYLWNKIPRRHIIFNKTWHLKFKRAFKPYRTMSVVVVKHPFEGPYFLDWLSKTFRNMKMFQFVFDIFFLICENKLKN